MRILKAVKEQGEEEGDDEEEEEEERNYYSQPKVNNFIHTQTDLTPNTLSFHQNLFYRCRI